MFGFDEAEEQNEAFYYEILSIMNLALENYESVERHITSTAIDTENVVKSLSMCSNLTESILQMKGTENTWFSAALSHIQADLKKQAEKLIPTNLSAKSPPSVQSNSKNSAPAEKKPASGQQHDENKTKQFHAVLEETRVTPSVEGFHQVAGLFHVKNALELSVILPMKQPQLYSGLGARNCVLLYGPPGTGKTKVVHALAAETRYELHCVGADTILSSYVGQTEKILRFIFQHMKESDAKRILFIDEIDGLCRNRSEVEHEYSRRLKTELMRQISDLSNNHNCFLICATNCPWDLDVAFIRRFQERIYVPLPDYSERLDLLRLYTRGTSLENTEASWHLLLEKTAGFSGSDMQDWVQLALRMPIMQLQQYKVWQKVGERYEPLTSYESEYTMCDLKDLPANSVSARNTEIIDLYQALNGMSKTVSEVEIEKYKAYEGKFLRK